MNKNEFTIDAPMGWNSYDYYNTTVDEEAVLKNAEYMANHLKDSGYEYIVIDIEWYAKKPGSMNSRFQYIPFAPVEIDKYSRLQPDVDRFPSSANGAGFKPLADKIHALGLKFGIHIMRGIPRIAAHNHMEVLGASETADMIADPSSICRWNPDMYGVRDTDDGQAYYDSIISMYADWGVDFIKCDDICNTNTYPHAPYSGEHEIEMIHNAIIKYGRPIVLSLSPGPALIDKAWHMEQNANMWRITDDFWDEWSLLKDMFTRCQLWEKHVCQGNYPDCDMIPIGKLGFGWGDGGWESRFTLDETKTMLTLWNIFGAPLMIGTDLPSLTDENLALLTNQGILGMHPVNIIPHQIRLNENEAIWEAIGNNEHFYAIFNLSDDVRIIETVCEDGSYEELWTNDSFDVSNGRLVNTLRPHACAAYRLISGCFLSL